tara:strand:- start:118 stop:408 length:291 start_codon:yes stop_codon:yes gene_type:complete
MAFTENLDTYLSDFGRPVIFGNKDFIGILEMPDQIIAGDMVITTDYQLIGKASDMSTLVSGDNLKIKLNNVMETFEVRSTRLIDDGSFVEVMLSKP